MNIYCSLRIKAGQNLDAINKIMDMNINNETSGLWMFEVEASELNPYPKILNQFVDLIEIKLPILNNIGVNKDDITIWLLIESDGEEQTNIEFNAELLLKLSKTVVSFCISSWQKICIANGRA